MFFSGSDNNFPVSDCSFPVEITIFRFQEYLFQFQIAVHGIFQLHKEFSGFGFLFSGLGRGGGALDNNPAPSMLNSAP